MGTIIVLALVSIYLFAATQVARTLCWYWKEKWLREHKGAYAYDTFAGERRLGTLLLAIGLLPLALLLIRSYHTNTTFERPPRSVRKAQEAEQRQGQLEEAKAMVDSLQREIDQLAKQ